MPAFDAASSLDGAGASSFSWSHTCTGSNRWLQVAVGGQNGTSITTTSVTYNSVALTELWDIYFNSYIFGSMSHLANPASGANTIAVTLSGGGNVTAGLASSYTDVHQTTPVDTAATATGTQSDPTVNVSSASGDLVVDAVSITDSAINVGAGQTSRAEFDGLSGGLWSGGISEEAGAATVTMSWTRAGFTNNVDEWIIGGISVNPPAAGGATWPGWMWNKGGWTA